MKKIMIAAAALLLSVATYAQTDDAPPPGGPPQQGNGQQQMRRAPMSPDQRAKRETDQINSLVALGGSYQKVLDVNTQIAQQRETIMHGAKRNEMTEDQKAQMKQLKMTQEKQLKDVMGPDLYHQYREAEKARRESSRGGNGGQPQGPPPGGGGQ